MSIKLIGAVLIIAGCGGVGFSMASAYRKEEKNLRLLIIALDYMECDLQYRLVPLPELCRGAAKECGGYVRQILNTLSVELDRQIAPDVATCMAVTLRKYPKLSAGIKKIMLQLGRSLGQFDLVGQMKGIETIRLRCRQELELLSVNRENRLRSYQTLGLCAGTALAVLLF